MKRILLKLSGEALSDRENGEIYDVKVLEEISSVVKEILSRRISVSIVVGGGNIFRGRTSETVGLSHEQGDWVGMLATLMNALTIRGYFENHGIKTKVMSALECENCGEKFDLAKANYYLGEGYVVIFACGVGKVNFTTDSGAALRALQTNTDLILMGKNGVEGVMSDDPRVNKDAYLIKRITYREIIDRDLKVMDQTAARMLVDSDVSIRVFNMADLNNAVRIVDGADIGTLITK